jgi:hypothetical protein
MEFVEARAQIVDPTAKTVNKAFGLDADSMSDIFARIAAELITLYKDKPPTQLTMGDIISLVSSDPEFGPFIFASGFSHFVAVLNHVVDTASEEK